MHQGLDQSPKGFSIFARFLVFPTLDSRLPTTRSREPTGKKYSSIILIKGEARVKKFLMTTIILHALLRHLRPLEQLLKGEPMIALILFLMTKFLMSSKITAKISLKRLHRFLSGTLDGPTRKMCLNLELRSQLEMRLINFTNFGMILTRGGSIPILMRKTKKKALIATNEGLFVFLFCYYPKHIFKGQQYLNNM